MTSHVTGRKLANRDSEHKRRYFDLATSIKEACVDFRGGPFTNDLNDSSSSDDDSDSPKQIQQSSPLLSTIHPVLKNLFRAKHKIKDYFHKANLVLQGVYYAKVPSLPLRTFVHESITFNLSQDPSLPRKLSITEVARKYNLPDLCHAVSEYLIHLKNNGPVPWHIGGRRSSRRPESSFLFNDIQVWYCFRLQSESIHYPHDILKAETINCHPPSVKYPRGLYDCVVVNADFNYKWPESKLKGMSGILFFAIDLIYCRS